jgi:hypothetical protein
MDTYPSASVPLGDYIPEVWECDPQACLERYLQNNLCHLLAMHDEYKYIHCGIKMKGIETYYDNVLK